MTGPSEDVVTLKPSCQSSIEIALIYSYGVTEFWFSITLGNGLLITDTRHSTEN